MSVSIFALRPGLCVVISHGSGCSIYLSILKYTQFLFVAHVI